MQNFAERGMIFSTFSVKIDGGTTTQKINTKELVPICTKGESESC